MIKPKIVLLIFVSGKIVLTGAKVREEIYTAFEMIYPVLQGRCLFLPGSPMIWSLTIYRLPQGLSGSGNPWRTWAIKHPPIQSALYHSTNALGLDDTNDEQPLSGLAPGDTTCTTFDFGLCIASAFRRHGLPRKARSSFRSGPGGQRRKNCLPPLPHHYPPTTHRLLVAFVAAASSGAATAGGAGRQMPPQRARALGPESGGARTRRRDLRTSGGGWRLIIARDLAVTVRPDGFFRLGQCGPAWEGRTLTVGTAAFTRACVTR